MNEERISCRPGCGACCIELSISSYIPGMPNGKPAGVPCPHLTDDLRCALYGTSERPAVCDSLRPSAQMCADSAEAARAYLRALEEATRP